MIYCRSYIYWLMPVLAWLMPAADVLAQGDWNARLSAWSVLGWGDEDLQYVRAVGRKVKRVFPLHAPPFEELVNLEVRGVARRTGEGMHLIEVLVPSPEKVVVPPGGNGLLPAVDGAAEHQDRLVLAVAELSSEARVLAEMWGATVLVLNSPVKAVSPADDAAAKLTAIPHLRLPCRSEDLRNAARDVREACLWQRAGAPREAAGFVEAYLGSGAGLMEPALLHHLADQRYLALYHQWLREGHPERFLSGLNRLLEDFPDPKVWQNRDAVMEVRSMLERTAKADAEAPAGDWAAVWRRSGPPLALRVRADPSNGEPGLLARLTREWQALMTGMQDTPKGQELGLSPPGNDYDGAVWDDPAMNAWRSLMRTWMERREEALGPLMEMMEKELAMPHTHPYGRLSPVCHVLPGEDWREHAPRETPDGLMPPAGTKAGLTRMPESEWRALCLPRPLSTREVAGWLLENMLPQDRSKTPDSGKAFSELPLEECKKLVAQWRDRLKGRTPWQTASLFYVRLGEFNGNRASTTGHLFAAAAARAPDAEARRQIENYLVANVAHDALADAYVAGLKGDLGTFLPRYQAAADQWLKERQLKEQLLVKERASKGQRKRSSSPKPPAVQEDWEVKELKRRVEVYAMLAKPGLFDQKLRALLPQGKPQVGEVFDVSFKLLQLIPPDEPQRAVPYLSTMMQLARKLSEGPILIGVLRNCMAGQRNERDRVYWGRYSKVLPDLIAQNREVLAWLLDQETDTRIYVDEAVPVRLCMALILECAANAEKWLAWHDRSPLSAEEKNGILIERAKARLRGEVVPEVPGG